MTSRSVIKRVRSLHQKKYRKEQGRFIIEGAGQIKEALQEAWPIETLYATIKANADLEPYASGSGLRAELVAPDDLSKMSTLKTGVDAIAVAMIPEQRTLPVLGKNEWSLALDDVNDPGNLGTIIRVADWFGISQVICSHHTVDAFNPKTVRSAMGSLFRVQVVHVDLIAYLREHQGSGAQILLASASGRSLYNVQLRSPGIIVLGNEASGISPAVLAVGGEATAIPRSGKAESLNVAMAATAFCAEIRRQFPI